MTNAFSTHGLVKTYDDFTLGPMNLDLAPGTVLGYIGPNGSGKTTTMHCIAGLIRPDEGTVDLFGRPNRPEDPEWRRDIGYVGDEQVFYENWTGEKNLKFISQFYPAWSDPCIADLTKRFNLPLDRKASDLSGGNRVKLSLIAALARSPRLLLLDEPTAGLDPVVRAELLDVLFEFMRDGERAIFYSTHILSDISRLADELAFVDNGRIKLRRAKEDLTDHWRRISFRSRGNNLKLAGVASHKHEGAEHLVISSDHDLTLRQLSELGVEQVEEQRMSIDEIAVQILKGTEHVANS